MVKKEKNVNATKKVTGISKTGKKIIFSGIAIVIMGFFVLSKADSFGQNWAATLSPFLILGGYVLIGVGIIFPDQKIENPI